MIFSSCNNNFWLFLLAVSIIPFFSSILSIVSLIWHNISSYLKRTRIFINRFVLKIRRLWINTCLICFLQFQRKLWLLLICSSKIRLEPPTLTYFRCFPTNKLMKKWFHWKRTSKIHTPSKSDSLSSNWDMNCSAFDIAVSQFPIKATRSPILSRSPLKAWYS